MQRNTLSFPGYCWHSVDKVLSNSLRRPCSSDITRKTLTLLKQLAVSRIQAKYWHLRNGHRWRQVALSGRGGWLHVVSSCWLYSSAAKHASRASIIHRHRHRHNAHRDTLTWTTHTYCFIQVNLALYPQWDAKRLTYKLGDKRLVCLIEVVTCL